MVNCGVGQLIFKALYANVECISPSSHVVSTCRYSVCVCVWGWLEEKLGRGKKEMSYNNRFEEYTYRELTSISFQLFSKDIFGTSTHPHTHTHSPHPHLISAALTWNGTVVTPVNYFISERKS